MSRHLNLAVAQLGPIHETDGRAAVVERLVALMLDAKSRGAEFVVFPELALTTFFPRHWLEDISEADQYYETEMPSAEVVPLFEAAAQAEVGFYIGYAELTSDGRRFNTSILVDRSGELVGKYRKIHLPGHAELKPEAPHQHLEKRYFEVGDLGWGVFEVDSTLMGMGLCNDRRWPETYRALSLQSAEIAVFGYNTPSVNPDSHEEPHLQMFNHLLSLQAGAYQNCLWVAAAGKSGFEDGKHLIGGSAIVAPSGEIVARSFTEGDEVITARIDLDMNKHFAEFIFNFGKHRRPENYGIIVERTGRGEPLPIPREKW